MQGSTEKATSKKNTKEIKDPRSTNVCKEFTEKVSVAGLEELNSDRDFPVRLLFAVGLLIAAVLTFKTSFKVVQEYLHERSALEITFKDNGQILFPNVTVCTTAVSNATAAKRMVIVPKKVDDELKITSGSREELIENVIQFMTTSSLPRTFNANLFRYVEKTWTTTSEQFENQNEIIRQALPSCSLTLSNCFFDGQPFDCCAEIVLGSHDGYVCYSIPIVNHFGATSQIEKIYKKSDKRPIEFKVDAQMDWSHIPYIRGDDAYDGFLVIVGQPYTVRANNPIAVAPGWHATIKLAQIKHHSQKSNCISRSRLPNMAYMSYYDEDGKNCEMDNTIVKMHKGAQCTLPMSTYFPNASLSCSFRQMHSIISEGNGAVDDFGLPDKFKKLSVSKILLNIFNSWGYVHEYCYPICDRWQYEPIVGYSELRNKNGSASDLDRNVSWSRITVSLPSAYYEVYGEGSTSTIFIVICNIGKSICIYAGVSMISFVEIFAYGLHSCYLVREKRKARRVQPVNLIQLKTINKITKTNNVAV